MNIRLGQGYWVDASDGLNWTLYHDKEGQKRPVLLGYCSNLARAMEMAVMDGLQATAGDIPLSKVNELCEYIAGEVLSEVVITTVRDKLFGVKKHFTPKLRRSVQGTTSSEG
jgi:hypothetical protein